MITAIGRLRAGGEITGTGPGKPGVPRGWPANRRAWAATARVTTGRAGGAVRYTTCQSRPGPCRSSSACVPLPAWQTGNGVLANLALERVLAD